MATTKTAIFKPRDIQVEIQDVFECGGKKLAVVKALSGEPFADGAKTTTRTAFRTVSLGDLDHCTCTPRDEIACRACRRFACARYGDEIPF
jgi:hypothetical protein